MEDENHIKDEELRETAGILCLGGLVVFPTEAVYGLSGNALDEDATGKIYATKRRPSGSPLIVHVSRMEEVAPLVEEIPEVDRRLMEALRPGPLTIILPKSDKAPYGTADGLGTMAIRMLDDPVANRLIALAGAPVAAPSANTSGRSSPTTADHIWQDMNGRTETIIDGGLMGIGVESTIVGASSATPVVLRPGVVTTEMLEAALGGVSADPVIPGPLSTDVRSKTPGVKYKHHAPKANLTLVEPEGVDRGNGLDGKRLRAMIGKARGLSRGKIEANCKVGVTCAGESRHCYTNGTARSIDEQKSQASVTHNLYALLRGFDGLGVDCILSESFPRDHLGQVIMNHLSKVMGYEIVKA